MDGCQRVLIVALFLIGSYTEILKGHLCTSRIVNVTLLRKKNTHLIAVRRTSEMQPDIDLHDDLQVPFQPAVANEFTPMTAYLLTGKIWLFITWGYLYEQELQFSTRDSHYPQLAKETWRSCRAKNEVGRKCHSQGVCGFYGNYCKWVNYTTCSRVTLTSGGFSPLETQCFLEAITVVVWQA